MIETMKQDIVDMTTQNQNNDIIEEGDYDDETSFEEVDDSILEGNQEGGKQKNE